MSEPGSVTTWLDELKRGQPHAAQPLWERYFARLVELARGKLAGLPRRVADEEDVALSAFQSFCVAAAAQRFPQLDSRDDLWQVLVLLTARKAAQQRRYQQRQKRGGEAHEEELALDEVIGSEPDPAFAALVADQFQSLLARLADDTLRTIALLKLEGYSNGEIAAQLPCSLRTVERRLCLIRSIWQEAGPD
ncbi:MAG: ECF-type sigma factor [Gemmataceae bacterium]|nr:ECF-type sigma factor [Gemmataceae bacterium]